MYRMSKDRVERRGPFLLYRKLRFHKAKTLREDAHLAESKYIATQSARARRVASDSLFLENFIDIGCGIQ